MCLIGYYTLMRPKCNRFLTWEEVTLDPANRTGWYQLDKHKNVNKGIKARGPLAAELVDYIAAIRPANASGPIHVNPSTGEPYVLAGVGQRSVADRRLLDAEDCERCRRRDRNVRAFPTEHHFLHQVELDVEVVFVHGRDACIAHHLHDGEQVRGRFAALRDVRRASVAEVEELALLPFEVVAEHAAGDFDQATLAPHRRQDQHAMKPGRSAHAPEIREATQGSEQVMPSRLLSALHRHPKLSRPRRRAASAPQVPAVASEAASAAADSVAPAAGAAEPPKPRRTRTPSCVKVASRFRYTSDRDGEVVPMLRLSGHWLEKHGFSIEGEVYIEAAEGRLILTNYATHITLP
jgi:hypothetical protein